MKVIYVNIENTICKTNHYDYRKSTPIRERIEKINKLYDEDNIIVYWTGRSCMSGIPWATYRYEQLKQWGCRFHQIKTNKPEYDVLIDDKNIDSDDFLTNNL